MRKYEEFNPYDEKEDDPYMADRGEILIAYYALDDLTKRLNGAIGDLRKGHPVAAFEKVKQVWDSLDDLKRRGTTVREVKSEK